MLLLPNDLMWNLLPVDCSFNTHKGNLLVSLDFYFDKIYSLQHQELQIIINPTPKNKFLKEYFPLFPTLSSPGDSAYEKYRKTIQPHTSIA